MALTNVKKTGAVFIASQWHYNDPEYHCQTAQPMGRRLIIFCVAKEQRLLFRFVFSFNNQTSRYGCDHRTDKI